jgi:hypothetical protein
MAVVFGLTAVEILMLLFAGFAGGAFGAAIGALPAFVFAGIMVIAGEAANVLAAELGAGGDISVAITGSLGFGPVFGPHVAFAGGVAAAAYAAKNGGMPEPEDGEYHQAKDITYALGARPDILAVGGVFGMLGVVLRQTSQGLLVPVDPPAVGVIGTAVVARLVFDYPLVGTIRGDGLFDMTPFERGENRTMADGGTTTEDGRTMDATRLAVEPWLPHQYKWSHVATIGFVAGVLGGYIGIVTGSAVLAFGISAASLLFLNLGVEQFPVTHHMTLPSSFVAIMVTADSGGTLTGLNEPVALALAGGIGILGAVLGEVVQRVFYAHSDTHFDPPAASIILTTLLLGALSVAGVLPGIGTIPGTV